MYKKRHCSSAIVVVAFRQPKDFLHKGGVSTEHVSNKYVTIT